MRTTKKIVLCAILSALGVAFIVVFSLLDLLHFSIAYLVSIMLLFVLTEMGWKWAAMMYAVISVILLVTIGFNNFAAFSFIFLIGHMPLIWKIFEKVPKIIAWLSKLAISNALLFTAYFVFKNIVVSQTDTTLILVITLILANIVYFLGYLLYDRLVRIYAFRIRPKLEKYLK